MNEIQKFPNDGGNVGNFAPLEQLGALPQAFDFEDFFEEGGIPLHLVGCDGTILRANKAELELLGYDQDEYVGQSITAFHADADVIADILARLSGGEKLQKYPARLRARDGSIKHVEITSSVQFRDGEFINTRCFSVDVTDLVHAREALRRKDIEHRQVLDALPAAVYTTDASGLVTYYNRAAAELAGREPQIGKDQWSVTIRLRTSDGNELPLDQCPMATTLKENRPVRGVEAMAQRPDGSLCPILPFPTPIRGEDGELLGAVNMLVDITDRKEAEAHQKLLLNELNHRVKNNMQMLHGLLRAAQRDTKSPEAQAVLADACQRVAAIAAAQQHLYTNDNSHSIDTEGFMRSVCASAEQAFGKEITVKVDAQPGFLSNNITMPLALILHELLTNSAKHGINGGGSGNIDVSLRRSDGQMRLCVEDDGPGFDLHSTGRQASGLGLVTGLARQLRGTFTVERGPGARCIVSFPEMQTH